MEFIFKGIPPGERGVCSCFPYMPFPFPFGRGKGPGNLRNVSRRRFAYFLAGEKVWPPAGGKKSFVAKCVMPPAGNFLAPTRKLPKNRPKGSLELPLEMPFPFVIPQALLSFLRYSVSDFKKCVALNNCVASEEQRIGCA